MAGTPKLIATTAFLPNAAGNIYTPPASTILTTIRHIHIANVTTSPITFSLYIGATGASVSGTELFKDYSLDGKKTYDYYGPLVMKSTDFLTGVASAASSLTITVVGEQSVVP